MLTALLGYVQLNASESASGSNSGGAGSGALDIEACLGAASKGSGGAEVEAMEEILQAAAEVEAVGEILQATAGAVGRGGPTDSGALVGANGSCCGCCGSGYAKCGDDDGKSLDEAVGGV